MNRFIVRQLALPLLVLTGCTNSAPMTMPVPPEARRPADRRAMEFWYANMARHGYSPDEMFAAAAMSDGEVRRLARRVSPARNPEGRLLVLPYPGGRHPRAGFLDGAIDPQRETKVSVFAPWPDGGYLVVDVPEAIFTNLGLTYLAHTHIPTIWTEKGVKLQRLEWNVREDGTLDAQRLLPNGIRFGAKIEPAADHVVMELWIHNGTDRPLTDVRAQVCTMFNGLNGFEQQRGDTVTSRPPLVVRKAREADRWVATAWRPLHRVWNNPPVPCIHSDPKFEDIPARESRRVRGVLGFYEGIDPAAFAERLQARLAAE
jgi:hypothetical protein